MAKSLVLGNGILTIGFDHFSQVKDVYFDHVGLENQMGEMSVNKVGVMSGSSFSWFDDGSWEFVIDYKPETLVGSTKAVNTKLSLEIEITDCVYNEKAIFIRNFQIKNLSSERREVKLFLNHQFEMYRTPKGDTVYFDPNDQTIVHYKGRRVALISGILGENSFTDYSVGLCGIEGKDGTYKDAEDGSLSKNSIEHGNVDSTVSFSSMLDPGSAISIPTWVVFGKSVEEVKELHKFVLKKAPMRICESTEDYWRAWVNKVQFSCHGLKDEVTELFKKSMLILRAHVGEEGEMIASIDSDMLQWGRDNYNYVWPRDGAFIAESFDSASYSEVSRKFFEFCEATISEQGFFYHKYRPDRALGSSWHGWVGQNREVQLPIQEDETAIVIIALWNHYEHTKDLEYVEKVYNPLIKKACDFMASFRDSNGIPLPTYDIWEMKMGVHTYTVASVYKALLCGAEFALLLGKEFDTERYKKAAEEIKAQSGIFWNESRKFFKKSLSDNTLDSSSFYGAFAYGLFDKKEIETAYKTFCENLVSSENAGGVVRFQGDEYFREDSSSLGNPWLITTLWKAQYVISCTTKESDLLEVKSIFKWIAGHALRSGVLSEQIHPKSGYQLSASPLAWSHAEFIKTAVLYMRKLEELGICEMNIVPKSPK